MFFYSRLTVWSDTVFNDDVTVFILRGHYVRAYNQRLFFCLSSFKFKKIENNVKYIEHKFKKVSLFLYSYRLNSYIFRGIKDILIFVTPSSPL
jgi:hypothetical protein